MLIVFVLVVVAIFLRFMVVKQEANLFDTYGHLYFVKEVKSQAAGPFGKIKTNVVGTKDFWRPFLWHWLLGFFPIQILLKYQKWVNPAADALFAVFLYGVGCWLGFDKQLSVWLSLIYLFTPMWFSRISIGPRVESLTPRLSSELVTNIFFIVTLLPLGMPEWVVFVLGSQLAAFVLLSSKFGLQALFFLAPVTTFLTSNFVPLYALLLGILFAFFITRGSFWQRVKNQLTHLTWYFKKNKMGEMSVSKRNSIDNLFKNLDFKSDYKDSVLKLIKRLIRSNSYTGVLLKMPALIVVLTIWVYSFWSGAYIPAYYILGPVFAATIIYLLVNVPVFLFLGEAERYLNHVAFFIVSSATLLITNLNQVWILWILLAYGFVYWVVESFVLQRLMPDRKKNIEQVDSNIISFFQSLKDPTVIISYPYNSVGVWRALLETNHKVVFPAVTTKKFLDFFEEEYAADYPYFKLEKLDEMAEDLNISIVIAEKDNLSSKGHDQWVPSGGWKRIKVGEPVYKIYVREDIEKI